jgi:septum formation protein
MKPIILASASPRRIALLKFLGCKFKIIRSKAEEKINPNLSPIQNVKRLSRIKALDVASRVSKGIIIAADTIVVFREKVLGKPKNKRKAQVMLRKLSGNEHKVITGITVIDAKTKDIKQTVVITRVKFRKLDKGLINRYIATGEPLDKAGAYGIQEKGSLLVESIKGDYFNVVGLPLNPLNQLLEKFGVSLI